MWCFDENATSNNFGKNLITLSGKKSQRKRSHALIYVGIYDRVKLHGIPMVTLLAENVLPNQALNSPDLRYKLYLSVARKQFSKRFRLIWSKELASIRVKTKIVEKVFCWETSTVST